VSQTATSPIVRLRLASIVRLPEFEARPRHRGTVWEYVQKYRAGIEMPPVTVAVVNGAPTLIDGWHRMDALAQLRREEVDAFMLGKLTEAAARWMAYQANMGHGRKLAGEQWRGAFVAYMEAGEYRKGKLGVKALRQIARELGGRSHNTIRKWMREDYPHLVGRWFDAEDASQVKRSDKRVVADFAMATRNALEQAGAAFHGVTDPRERGKLIETARAVLQSMEDGGPWVEPAAFESDDF
jgi:hypothetical protein